MRTRCDHFFQKLWQSEELMFSVAVILIVAGGGMFIFTPLIALVVLMSGPTVWIAMVGSVATGCVAWARALVLQRRRYADESAG